jgi:hypothetical protein
MRAVFSRFGLIVCVLAISLSFGSSCSRAESKTSESAPSTTTSGASGASTTTTTLTSRGPTIEIKPNSPADTVRTFYRHLREKKFRDAIFLTNLRPAVEGLTDSELKEFQVDFEAIAKFVPSELQINGEIITGDSATVTAKLPNEDMDREEIQEIKLRKEGDFWVILTVDESAEKRIMQDGKNYFPNLRIDTHQDEARDMLDRVAKAQMVFATQNQGNYGDIDALIKGGLVPEDIRSSVSTGYVYTVTLTPDRKRYAATAVPAVYGKTGKLSYAVELDKVGQPRLVTRDPAGKTK